MNNSDVIKQKIIKALDKHLFSEKRLPEEVRITTIYNESRQELRIHFEETKGD